MDTELANSILRLSGDKATVVIHQTGMNKMKDYFLVFEEDEDEEVTFICRKQGWAYEAYLRDNLRVKTEYLTYFLQRTYFTKKDFKEARRKAYDAEKVLRAV